MPHIFDVIAVGGGPAGYTAALYAARSGLDTLVIERMTDGGQMTLTERIDNYPGFDGGIGGFELGRKMKEGAHRFGAKTIYAEVKSAELSDKIKILRSTTETYYAKAVIIAAGADPKKLGIPFEKELSGKGIHYCAHCDGRFYKGKTVAVVGGGNSALSDALYLSGIAERVVLIHRKSTLRAEKLFLKRLESSKNISFLPNRTVTEPDITDRIVGIKLKDVHTQETETVPCDGIFISIGRKPATDFLHGCVGVDEAGYITADETTRTDTPGVFAAGDIRTKALRQIVTAASDGACAAHFAKKYLTETIFPV